MIAYSFDAAGRLIGSLHGDHAHRYSVDAAGNRLAPQDNQQSLPDNRLTQLNGARYRYDGAGNLIERQQPNGERLTLGYDGANRLVHLIHASELGASREASYGYDGLGRRISKTVRHAKAPPPPPTTAGTGIVSSAKKPTTSALRWSTSRAVLCPCSESTIPSKAS